jgi:tetratricopeptide (TPR) repeat protein
MSRTIWRSQRDNGEALPGKAYRSLMSLVTLTICIGGCAAGPPGDQVPVSQPVIDAYWAACTTAWSDPHKTVEGCTAVLQSSALTQLKQQRAEYSRGAAYVAMGQPESAIPDLDVAIQLYPDDVTAFIKRCEAYVDIGQPGRAIEDCNRAIRLDPSNAGAFQYRGRAWLAIGNQARARADFARASKLPKTIDW